MVLLPFAAVRPLRLRGPAILGALAVFALVASAVPVPAAAGATTPRPSWSWPLAAPHPIQRPYLAPATRYGSGHRGIDIGAPAGAQVLAPDDGIVYFAGVVVDRPVLSIRHADGLLSSYEPVTTTLIEGDPVRRGQAVGLLVAGHCADPCLHFGVRLYGEYVSPLGLLGDIPRPVLLPTRHLG